MRRVKVVFLSLLCLVIMTGCEQAKEEKKSEQKLVCTATEKEDGMDIEEVISMTYKNDKLKHMTIEVNTIINDETVQKNWSAFKEAMNKENGEFTKEGISLKVETNDQKYEYKTSLDIDVDKASTEDLKEQGFSDLKEDDSTLESTKKAAEEDGAVCVIK